jgi:hypothetical protein
MEHAAATRRRDERHWHRPRLLFPAVRSSCGNPVLFEDPKA